MASQRRSGLPLRILTTILLICLAAGHATGAEVDEPIHGVVIPAGAIRYDASAADAPPGKTLESRGWTTILSDGFEGAWHWSTLGDPSWRDTSYRACGGTWSAWCADDGLTPPGPYASNMNAWMIYGPIDLSDAVDAQVSFDFWLDSEANYDYLKWGASADGTSFSGYQRSGREQACESRTFSLSDHLGDSSVWFAFWFTSDEVVQYEGAYVDNILIEKSVDDSDYCNSCPTYDWSISPSTSYQTHAASIGHDGCRWYRVYMSAGNAYTFTVCADGGSYADDTVFELHNSSCSEVANDDDTCGTGSEIVYVPTTAGYYYLRVRGYGYDPETYTLAYKREVAAYSVSGTVSSRRWPHFGLPDVVVQADTGQSATTDVNGDYTINNVPAGYRTISASRTDWWATGTSNSDSQGVNLTGNITGVDFDDFACKATADVAISVDDTTVEPGQTFQVTVSLQNDNYAVGDVSAYLDLSFDDTKVTVGTPTGSGWTAIQTYPPGSGPLYGVDSGGYPISLAAYEHLISGVREGSLGSGATYSFSVPLTVRASASPGPIILKYRGTIGDERDPNSTGSGTRDQQGFNVYTYTVDIAEPLPDLMGNTLAVADTLAAGATFDAVYTVDNAGGPTPAGFYVAFYASVNSTISTSDTLLGRAWVGAMAANTCTLPSTASLTLPGRGDSLYSSGDGTYYVGMIVDVDGDVDEADEDNNRNRGSGIDREAVQVHDTALPAPTINAITLNGSAADELLVMPGEPVNIAVTASNGGGNASPGLIQVSIPQLTQATDRLLVTQGTPWSADLAYFDYYPGGPEDIWYQCGGTPYQAAAQHLLVIAQDTSWTGGESNTATFSFAPTALGSYAVRVKCGLAADESTYVMDPTSGPEDQQCEHVHVRTIHVSNTPYQVSYGYGVQPDSVRLYERKSIRLTVTNTGDQTIPTLGIGVDIHDPAGAKVESTRTGTVDPDTGRIGRIDFAATPQDLAVGQSRTFEADYTFATSAVGDEYAPGSYAFKYVAWTGGMPGDSGADMIGGIQSEPLAISAGGYPAKQIPILMYHKVDTTAPTEYWVTQDDFRAQMGLLCGLGYESIDYDDLRNYLHHGTALPQKPVIITFDDAYQNVHDHAWPVLADYGFTATVHVATDFISDTEASRQDNSWDFPTEPLAMHMIWPELQALHAAGWAIENHSAGHPDFGTLPYAEKVTQVRSARTRIFLRIGEWPDYFCYPFGYVDTELKQIVQDEAHLGAVGTGPGIEDTSTADLFDLDRIGILADDTLDDFAAKIGESGPHDPDIHITSTDITLRRRIAGRRWEQSVREESRPNDAPSPGNAVYVDAEVGAHFATTKTDSMRVFLVLPQHETLLKMAGAARKTAIQSEGEAVSTALGKDFQILRRYASLPMIYGRLTADGLTQCRRGGLVDGVLSAEGDVRAVLDTSIPLIEGDHATDVLGLTGAGVTVAVLDTGVDYDHPALGGGFGPGFKVVGGHDFASSPEDDDPMDDNGHGTHVAGIVASEDASRPGVAPSASIVALKVLDASGHGGWGDIAAGVDWCVTHRDAFGIDVINMSIGDGNEYDNPAGQCDNTGVGIAIRAARNAGIITFAASGNDGHDNGLSLPGCVSEAVSVGAVYDADLGREPDSGVYLAAQCSDATTAAEQITCFTNTDEILDLVAPGARITSARVGGGWKWDSGTSMASPHAAGVAALLLEANGALSPDEVHTAVASGSRTAHDPRSGLDFPLLNARETIESVAQGFVIKNEGAGTLRISSMVAQDSSPWLSFAAVSAPLLPPFDIPACASKGIQVSASIDGLAAGTYQDRILVHSDDPDESPYPSGVNVTLVVFECAEDGECDDDNACTSDACVGGFCQNTARPNGTTCPDDGNDCTDDECAAGYCTHPPAPAGTSCGDAGVSICSAPDACDDAGSCLPNHAPDGTPCPDGQFCNGEESCVSGTCAAGADPCPGQPCNEAQGACVACDEASDCDDGLFCNGQEQCIAGDCVPGGAPCTDPAYPFCDEVDDACDACVEDDHCADGVFCNGAEPCVDGACVPGSDPCVDPGVPYCIEDAQRCAACLEDAHCDDAQFCNGAETCDSNGTCQPGGDPCEPFNCDEAADACVGGACCHPDASCVDFALPSACQAVGQVFHDGQLCDDAACLELGACCAGDVCHDAVSETSCHDELGGYFVGVATVCAPELCSPGACCTALGTCLDARIEPECTASGGTFQGAGTNCAFLECPQPVGACCIGGICIPDQHETNCAGAGGAWAGAGTSCASGLCANGACCVNDACTLQEENSCLSAGGAWLGLFSVCFDGLCPICDDGDFDGNGRIDLQDFAGFQICFQADGAGDCKCLDMDNDNDVDLADYGLFAPLISGP